MKSFHSPTSDPYRSQMSLQFGRCTLELDLGKTLFAMVSLEDEVVSTAPFPVTSSVLLLQYMIPSDLQGPKMPVTSYGQSAATSVAILVATWG